MATFNLQDWDRTGKLSPYKTSVGTQALEGVTGLMAMLQQQQQDKALRQAAGQMMGGQAVPQGVNAGDLYSKLAVEKSKPMHAGSILDQIELQNVMNGLKETATPPVANTLGGAVPQQNPEVGMSGIPPMFVPGKTDKYGVLNQADNPDFEIYQKKRLLDLQPATAGQETNALYAKRVEQADKVFDKIPEVGLGYGLSTAKLPFNIGLPNFAKSGKTQSVEQAKRNFLNAVLRKESGAVISPTEFSEGNMQYFPQPGDKPDVLALKKQNRKTVISSMKQSSGKAYTPEPGNKTFTSEQEALASGYKGEAIINGRRARID